MLSVSKIGHTEVSRSLSFDIIMIEAHKHRYIGSAFEKEASSAMVDMQGDDEEEQNKRKKLVW